MPIAIISYNKLHEALTSGVNEYLDLRKTALNSEEKFKSLKAVFAARCKLGFFNHHGEEGLNRARKIKIILDGMNAKALTQDDEKNLTALLFILYYLNSTGLLNCITPRLVVGSGPEYVRRNNGGWEYRARSKVFSLIGRYGNMNTGCGTDDYDAIKHIISILVDLQDNMDDEQKQSLSDAIKTLDFGQPGARISALVAPHNFFKHPQK